MKNERINENFLIGDVKDENGSFRLIESEERFVDVNTATIYFFENGVATNSQTLGGIRETLWNDA
jgi:hypothetical protein